MTVASIPELGSHRQRTQVCQRLLRLSGIRFVLSLGCDVPLLYLQRLFRMFGFGASTLVHIPFMKELGISEEQIGLFMCCTLIGDAAVSTFTSMFADRIGRRQVLVLGSVLMATSGVVFATCDNFWILLLASIIGVVSPSGADVGPFMAIEETSMAQLVAPDLLNVVLAWYYMLGSWGAAGGTLVAGWVVEELISRHAWSNLAAYRVIFVLYCALGIIKIVLSVLLSKKCEPSTQVDNDQGHDQANSTETQPLLEGQRQTQVEGTRISPETRSFTAKMCSILILDSIGAGIASHSWLTFFFRTKFDLASGLLGSTFAFTTIIESLSNVAAIPLVRKIGLVPTMLFGHVFAALALFLLPLPNLFAIALGLLVTRAVFLDFDQAPRQTFISKSVLPKERTLVLGIINIVRTFGQSIGPILTGFMALNGLLGPALSIAGCIKLCCDLILLVWYLHM